MSGDSKPKPFNRHNDSRKAFKRKNGRNPFHNKTSVKLESNDSGAESSKSAILSENSTKPPFSDYHSSTNRSGDENENDFYSSNNNGINTFHRTPVNPKKKSRRYKPESPSSGYNSENNGINTFHRTPVNPKTAETLKSKSFTEFHASSSSSSSNENNSNKLSVSANLPTPSTEQPETEILLNNSSNSAVLPNNLTFSELNTRSKDNLYNPTRPALLEEINNKNAIEGMQRSEQLAKQQKRVADERAKDVVFDDEKIVRNKPNTSNTPENPKINPIKPNTSKNSKINPRKRNKFTLPNFKRTPKTQHNSNTSGNPKKKSSLLNLFSRKATKKRT
jgi:hypothetical protein